MWYFSKCWIHSGGRPYLLWLFSLGIVSCSKVCAYTLPRFTSKLSDSDTVVRILVVVGVIVVFGVLVLVFGVLVICGVMVV